MAATVVTKEPLEIGIDDAAIEREKSLRIKAGAITCKVEEENGQKIMYTEWNVIGEQ